MSCDAATHLLTTLPLLAGRGALVLLEMEGVDDMVAVVSLLAMVEMKSSGFGCRSVAPLVNAEVMLLVVGLVLRAS